MFIVRCRPLAGVAAALITAIVLLCLDAGLGVERLQVALGGTV